MWPSLYSAWHHRSHFSWQKYRAHAFIWMNVFEDFLQFIKHEQAPLSIRQIELLKNTSTNLLPQNWDRKFCHVCAHDFFSYVVLQPHGFWWNHEWDSRLCAEGHSPRFTAWWEVVILAHFLPLQKGSICSMDWERINEIWDMKLASDRLENNMEIKRLNKGRLCGVAHTRKERTYGSSKAISRAWKQK